MTAKMIAYGSNGSIAVEIATAIASIAGNAIEISAAVNVRTPAVIMANKATAPVSPFIKSSTNFRRTCKVSNNASNAKASTSRRRSVNQFHNQ